MDLARHCTPEPTAKVFVAAERPELEAAVDAAFTDLG